MNNKSFKKNVLKLLLIIFLKISLQAAGSNQTWKNLMALKFNKQMLLHSFFFKL